MFGIFILLPLHPGLAVDPLTDELLGAINWKSTFRESAGSLDYYFLGCSIVYTFAEKSVHMDPLKGELGFLLVNHFKHS